MQVCWLTQLLSVFYLLPHLRTYASSYQSCSKLLMKTNRSGRTLQCKAGEQETSSSMQGI